MSGTQREVTLSIVMPVYNESATIRHALDRVLDVDFPCPVELVVVDDGSADDTAAILSEYVHRGIRFFRHGRNQGKGAAVRTGVAQATGTHLIILDADLEYSPRDIPTMLAPVLEGRSDHVFGARIFGLNTAFQSFKFAVGGRLCTLAANLLFDSFLTDIHTCLKLIPRADFRAIEFTEKGFGLDTELTARLLRAGVRPFEVPVSYHGRSVDEGKKIGWTDGLDCLRILVKIRLQAPTKGIGVRPTSARPALHGVAAAEVWRVAPAAPVAVLPSVQSARPVALAL